MTISSNGFIQLPRSLGQLAGRYLVGSSGELLWHLLLPHALPRTWRIGVATFYKPPETLSNKAAQTLTGFEFAKLPKVMRQSCKHVFLRRYTVTFRVSYRFWQRLGCGPSKQNDEGGIREFF